MTPQEQPDSQAGDEQTETDELKRIITDAMSKVYGYESYSDLCRYDADTNVWSIASNIVREADAAVVTLEAWSRQQTAQVLDSLIKTGAHTFTVGAIKAARAGLYRHTGGNDMTTEHPDGTQGDLESSKAPAEALRQQILKAAQENFDNGEYIVDGQDWRRFLDDAMELVTAYAATVEREAAIREWLYFKAEYKGFEDDPVDWAAFADSRLAALQGPETNR